MTDLRGVPGARHQIVLDLMQFLATNLKIVSWCLPLRVGAPFWENPGSANGSYSSSYGNTANCRQCWHIILGKNIFFVDMCNWVFNIKSLFSLPVDKGVPSSKFIVTYGPSFLLHNGKFVDRDVWFLSIENINYLLKLIDTILRTDKHRFRIIFQDSECKIIDLKIKCYYFYFRYVMDKLGSKKIDLDQLLDEVDKNKDGVIDYEGWFILYK